MVAVRAAIIKRYRLLPYWYTLFHSCAKSGAPVMRPLWVEFPSDRTTFGVDNEHTVGSALLVHPVTRSRAAAVTVLLPDATQVIHLVYYNRIEHLSQLLLLHRHCILFHTKF